MSLFGKKANEQEQTAAEKNSAETLGARIAKARKQHGYTQEEFSQLLGVTAQAVSKWENDTSCPDIMLLPKISDLLGISVDELLTGANKNSSEKAKIDSDTSKLCLRIHVLNENNKPINVALPMSMVKMMAKIGNGISGIVGSSSVNNIQLEQILDLVEEGVTGELLNVVTEDNTNVIIEVS